MFFKGAVSFRVHYHAVVSMTKSLAIAHMAGAQKAKGPPGESKTPVYDGESRRA